MAPFANHFETFDLLRTATLKDIKLRYKRLALQHHPDKNPANKQPTAVFQRIQAAYDVLGDEGKRMEYGREYERRSLRPANLMAEHLRPAYTKTAHSRPAHFGFAHSKPAYCQSKYQRREPKESHSKTQSKSRARENPHSGDKAKTPSPSIPKDDIKPHQKDDTCFNKWKQRVLNIRSHLSQLKNYSCNADYFVDSLLEDLLILRDKLSKERWHGTGTDSEEGVFVGWALENIKDRKVGNKGDDVLVPGGLREVIKERLRYLVFDRPAALAE